MQVLSKNDFKSFKTLAHMNQTNLHSALHKILVSMYSETSVVSTVNYTYAIGEIPICLVAHMDTVFNEPPSEIFYDRESNVIWSPQGLGADDRAGVFAIVKILSSGLRPHVIFTTDEELGCVGADILSYNACPFPECKFIIELDRAHEKDCVFYDCYNTDFENFIEQYGFETQMGTFSDICSLCPRWGIAGVNLSIGYRNEHSVSEVLFVKHMLNTIDKVKKILTDCCETTPTFVYYSLWHNEARSCYICNKTMPSYAMIPVIIDKDGYTVYMCGDCLTDKNVEWCLECGAAMLPGIANEDGLCPNCEMEDDDDDEEDFWSYGLFGSQSASERSDSLESGLYADLWDNDFFDD